VINKLVSPANKTKFTPCIFNGRSFIGLYSKNKKRPKNWVLWHSTFHFPVRRIKFILYRVSPISSVYSNKLFSVGQIWIVSQVSYTPYTIRIQLIK
jgi:hypothetical protein